MAHRVFRVPQRPDRALRVREGPARALAPAASVSVPVVLEVSVRVAPAELAVAVRPVPVAVSAPEVPVVHRELPARTLAPTALRVAAETLAANAGKVLTHRQILKQIWGAAYVEQPHVLRVNISNLRHKIGPYPDGSDRIKTVRGVGYILSDPPEEARGG